MKRIVAVFALAAISLLPGIVAAQTLYAATGSNGVDGILYRIDASSGAAAIVGPLLAGGSPIGLTGLAQNPLNGILYGITTADGPGPNATLFTIDPTNATAVMIGGLGANASDISFSAAGTLYTWLGGSRQLATVSLASGLATPVGPSGLASNVGGGLAFSPGGTLYLAATGSAGTLDTLNTATGAATTGPTITGAPVDAIDAMTFSSGGTLFGIATDRSSSPTTNFLVTINTTTGAATTIGALPGDMDALSFGPTIGPIPTLSQWSMIALAIALAALGLLAVRAFRVGRPR